MTHIKNIRVKIVYTDDKETLFLCYILTHGVKKKKMEFTKIKPGAKNGYGDEVKCFACDLPTCRFRVG